ncbi:hypothetical protein BACINT_03430 [Bacteroides intestinalis DSM 17393]|uniref:Uncharacterized protein n=1 Tax=Bacteroides intestinalis DSM 17393 TaxID=471870 RepID=B3CB44_9BACE|nr:hypothetical protein BACINT_03430 [Bacteroides intestinalis DSM 17393]
MVIKPKKFQKDVIRHVFKFGKYLEKPLYLQRYPENNLFTLKKN